MSRICASLVFAASLIVTSIYFAQAPAASGSFAITRVTVIDVENGTRSADQTVVVTANKIMSAGATAQTKPPNGARIVDGTGKFLIPGLWDMHVHTLEQLGIDYGSGMEPYELYIAHGVTGVRDMGSSYLQFVLGKKHIESAHIIAPRIFASGPMLEGGQPALQMALASKYVATPEAGRMAVETLKEAGVDFLKIHNGLTRETYYAITEEAKRRNMVFAGHVPDDVSATEASDAGQRSIEHLASFSRSCAVNPAALRDAANNPQPIEIDRAKCEMAARHLASNGTYLTPTLISSFPQTVESVPDYNARLSYIKPARRMTCPALPGQARPGARSVYEFNQRITKIASEAQVQIMTGTDSTTCRVPGFALQDEIAFLVDAGLTPAQALRAATLNPAAYLNLKDSLGTIARGKTADLVLLDADPLVDIHNTKRIAGVVANGRLVVGPERQKLLDSVLASAK